MMYTIEQINEITKAERRNCDLCPYSHIYGQASCKYRNEPDERGTPFQTTGFLEQKRTLQIVPCLKRYVQNGLHGYINPISGEPVIVTPQAARAIMAALDEEEAEQENE